MAATLNGGQSAQNTPQQICKDIKVALSRPFDGSGLPSVSAHTLTSSNLPVIAGNGTSDQPRWGTAPASDRLCSLPSHWGPGTHDHGVSQLQSETGTYEECGQSSHISALLSPHL